MNAGFASLVAGLCLLWLAVRLRRDWFFLTQPRLSALGRVADHRSISSEGGETSLLVVRFEANDGQTVDIEVSLGVWSHQIDVGSLIGVEYPAGYPKMAGMLGSRSFYVDYGLCFAVLAMLTVYMINPKWMSSI